MPPKASCTTANNHRLGRTFSGCLTCRRRKVKCDSQLSRSSCGNCKRMKLACQASFWTNFKDLTPAHKGSRAYIVSPPDSPDDSLGQPQNSQSATDTSKPDRTISLTAAEPRSEAIPPSQGHDPSGPIDATASPRAISHLDQDDTEELLRSISNDFFPTADFQLADVDMSGLFQNSVLLMPQSEAFNPREWQFDHVLSAMASENLSPSCSSALWPPRGGYSYDRLTQPTIANGLIPTASNEQISSDSSAITEFPGFPEFPPLNMDGFSLATQIPAVITATEGTLVRHYELYMSKFLSVKDPQWNLYTYMLLSPQGSSESPLRHSLLAWSAFHVSSMKENSLEEGVKYYHAASMAVDDLIKEVTSLSETSISAVRLRMLLSATFFLCYCDIMSCRPDRFHSRLQRLKAAIFHNWSWVTAALSPITSRLLIWISYLEIRASLWDAQKSTSNPGRPEKLLIDGLSDRVSLSSFYANSGSYLEECFGDQYPTSELKQDLQQEAGNLKLLDVMTILGQIITFQTWDRGTFTNNNSMMNELRTTKIRLLQAELGRIRAVGVSAISRNLHCQLT
jgi:hypothetical protein